MKNSLSDNVRQSVLIPTVKLIFLTGSVPVEKIMRYVDDYDNCSNYVINSRQTEKYTLNIKNSSYLIKSQIYTDFHNYLNFQDKLYDTSKLSKLPIIENYDDINDSLKDPGVFSHMFQAMQEVYNLDDYDRVLMYKTLDNRQRKYLKSLNPLFQEEDNIYNVKVDLDFIKNQISELLESNKDPDYIYDRLSLFLFDLHKIDKKEAEQLFIDLFNQDLGIISSTYEDENTIKMGDVVLRRDNLARMLKEYYKYESKHYGLNRGEEDDL